MGSLKEGSHRLDRTLSSDAFSYKDGLARIVKTHILKSSLVEDDPEDKLGGKHVDEVTQHWTGKISTFLDHLRSASPKLTGKLKPSDDVTVGQAREWKLKDETERYRVMYREGPEGTPFHTLCLDGIVDGDFASAMCVAWEAPLFKEWWPQFTVPTFKIIESKWLRRVRVGQDLALLRFKVPWPLAQREVVMSAFELEYLEDDLIIGLVESVPSEPVEINEDIYGFQQSDFPVSTTNVRMDVGGGFVMQRTSKDQFFFRTILSMDMKLDFVPPWMINFITRQVAGQGLKLYQKATLAATNGTGTGKAFQKLLKTGPMYNRVRSGLETKTPTNGDVRPTPQVIERPPPIKESGRAKSLQGSIRRMGSSEYTRVVPYPVKADEEEGAPEPEPEPEPETKESTVEERSAPLVADESVQPLLAAASPPKPVHEIKAVVEEIKPQSKPQSKPQERTIEAVQSDIAGCSSSNGNGSGSQLVQAHDAQLPLDEDVREYDDPDVVWAVNILDKMISYTRFCAAQQAAATSSQTLESQAKSMSLSSSTEADTSREAKVKGTSPKQQLPSANHRNKNNDLIVVKQATASSNVILKSDTIDSSRSRGLRSASGDAESSSQSGFWSASEIEVVSSQDDTDTDVGVSGSLLAGHVKRQEPELETKRRRKWRWTCFSPSSASRKHVVHGRGHFYARESGRSSDVTWSSSLMAGLGSQRQRLQSEGLSPDRFVTLGEVLLGNER